MKKGVYLDTNIIYGYFLAKSLELRKGISGSSKVIGFLKDSNEKFDYYVSVATRAETIRKLISELGMERETSKRLWVSFLEELNANEMYVTKSFNEVYEEITKIVEETVIKKRVANLEHLIIAKIHDLIFVTGDKEVLDKCKKYYPKIMSCIELRRVE